jgi:tetratricopeptide (TPR) repeat protein
MESIAENQQSILKAKKLIDKGHYSEASILLNNYLEKYPNSINALSTLCHLELLTQKNIEAEKTLNKVKQIAPEDPFVLHNIVRISLRKNDIESAMVAAVSAYNQQPDNLETQLILASALQGKGYLDKAKLIIDLIIEKNRNYAEAWASRALLNFRGGKIIEALSDIKSALELKKHISSWWQLLVKISLDTDNISSAIYAQQQIMKLEPRNIDHQASLGELYRRAGQVDKAIEVLLKATQESTTNFSAWVNLGVALQMAARFNEAGIAYEKALLINPKSAEVASNLGALANEAEDWESALFYFEQALDIQPKNDTIEDNIILTYINLNKFEEAIAALKIALTKRPNSPVLLIAQSHLLSKQAQPKEAIAYARKAVENQFNSLKVSSTKLLIDASRKPIPVNAAGDTLIELHELLTQLDIKYFIAFGTLLGIYRDGNILPYDKDLDIGLPWEIDRQFLINKIEKTDEWIIKGHQYLKNLEIIWKFSAINKKTSIAVDFFFFKPEGNNLISGLSGLPTPLKWLFTQIEIGSIQFRNILLPAPLNPEQFMQEIYGNNWHIPDPYFDSVVSGCNLTDESIPIAIKTGWIKLRQQLNNHNWKKARGYCSQLMNYGPDKLLNEISLWCEKQNQL